MSCMQPPNDIGGEVLGDDARVVLAFEGVDGGFHFGCGGAGSHGDGCLEDDAATIAFGADVMNRYAGFTFACRYYGLMDVATIHSLAAIFGQERGMNIDDAVGITVEQEVWYHEQESGKCNATYAISVEQSADCCFVIDFGSGHHSDWDTKSLRPLNYAGIGAIGHNDCNLHSA